MVQDFFDKLRAAWHAEQERRAQSRASSGRIDFVSAGSGGVSGGAVADAAARARAKAQAVVAKQHKSSRWDTSGR